MVSATTTRTSTTEMEVTSIRLEASLKDKLKGLSGNQGYQALIRDILWNYVASHTNEYKPNFRLEDIRYTTEAISTRDTHCTYTGKFIQKGDPMLIAFLIDTTTTIPLSVDYLSESS